jgi:hypothetical protein
MANEITVNLSTTLQNPSTATTGGLRDTFAPGSMRQNQSTAGCFRGTVATSTSEAAFPSSGLGTNGLMILQNLDNTNDIDWGPASGGTMITAGTLKAGGPPQMIYCKSTATFRHKAAAGTPRLLIIIYEV